MRTDRIWEAITTKMFEQFLKETPEIQTLIKTHGLNYCLIVNNKAKIDKHHEDEQLTNLFEVIRSISKPVKHVNVMQKKLDQYVSLIRKDLVDIIKIVNPNEKLPVETINKLVCDIEYKLSIGDFKRELGSVISGKINASKRKGGRTNGEIGAHCSCSRCCSCCCCLL